MLSLLLNYSFECHISSSSSSNLHNHYLIGLQKENNIPHWFRQFWLTFFKLTFFLTIIFLWSKVILSKNLFFTNISFCSNFLDPIFALYFQAEFYDSSYNNKTIQFSWVWLEISLVCSMISELTYYLDLIFYHQTQLWY